MCKMSIVHTILIMAISLQTIENNIPKTIRQQTSDFKCWEQYYAIKFPNANGEIQEQAALVYRNRDLDKPINCSFSGHRKCLNFNGQYGYRVVQDASTAEGEKDLTMTFIVPKTTMSQLKIELVKNDTIILSV